MSEPDEAAKQRLIYDGHKVLDKIEKILLTMVAEIERKKNVERSNIENIC